MLKLIGPITMEKKEYNGSIPSLVLRPQSWTKLCNIMFANLPFGTGFSYAKNTSSHRSDRKFVHHVHQFIRKWLIDHPEFLSNEFYVGGDSYAGIPIPAIVQEISNGNGKALQPLINLKGYLLGNPVTTRKEKNDRISYAHGMGLISNELYECISGIKRSHILDYYCEDEPHVWRRSLTQEFKESLSYHLTPPVPDLRCQLYKFYLNEIWANEERVRKALHIREGTIEKWIRCYRNDFVFDITNSVEFHVNLSKKGFRSLIYSGDHDLVVPFLSTQSWIKGLNYSIVDDWRSWLIKDQVAGYTRTYSNQMTFATLKGSGHTGPEYTPWAGFVMFSKWISNTPL
ncbi:serine carboxypeptidase-like 11 isoform X3 [Vicia villosa]|uniref:serine carboxypeptidase-like 11 isoform X3 n=1 Tax=Vicia villosa TaxID=3911 RepID=UPI00273C0C3A|nr:serine carboxypeptidase-like 11 isoform X3 [Vicia villosa]